MPYIQVDMNLWAVMRYPVDHPVAMILGLVGQNGKPQFLVQTWHPDPAQRRVISQHSDLAAANHSVKYDNSGHVTGREGFVDGSGPRR